MTPARRLGRPLAPAYTLFVGVLVPVYWREIGPGNFLWWCDVVLFMTVVALWVESRLLVSAAAVAVLIVDLIWNVNFFTHLLAGRDLLGFGLTDYMFDATQPLWLRALSLFHAFLLPLLLWSVYRLGYDRRGPLLATAAWWVLVPLSYWLGNPDKNVNWVFGLGDPPRLPTPFDQLPIELYLLASMLLMPLALFLPAHLVLRRLFVAREWKLWRR